jgi:hypothetical protein
MGSIQRASFDSDCDTDCDPDPDPDPDPDTDFNTGRTRHPKKSACTFTLSVERGA